MAKVTAPFLFLYEVIMTFVIPAQAGIHILKGSNLLRFGAYESLPPLG